MTWEGTARSVITRFRDPKSGEYISPARFPFGRRLVFKLFQTGLFLRDLTQINMIK
jgi:hypothetical protein